MARLEEPLKSHFSPPPIRYIIFDVSNTISSGIHTGIQRVVKGILLHADHVATNYDCRAFAAAVDGKRWRRWDVQAALQRMSTALVDSPSKCSARERIIGLVRPTYYKARLIVTKILPFDAVRSFIWASPDHFGLTSILLTPYRFTRSVMRPNRGITTRNIGDAFSELAPIDQSVLVFIDASWSCSFDWQSIQQFKQEGGRVVGVVYDLIPISHPQFFGDELPESFGLWIDNLLVASDVIVCISAFSAERLSDLASELVLRGDLSKSPLISHFHLGAEPLFPTARTELRPNITKIFSGERHVFLVVGSIDPRKNVGFILSAFESVWAQGSDAALVIIGKRSWGENELLQRVKSHPRLGSQLYLLRDVTDSELDYAYTNASALIFASIIEGFGLPIVEAFQRGLKVLCSDIPVFREIADGKANFFGLSSPDNLASAVVDFSVRNGFEIQTNKTKQSWLTWRESTEDFYSQMMTALSEVDRRTEASRELSNSASG